MLAHYPSADNRKEKRLTHLATTEENTTPIQVYILLAIGIMAVASAAILIKSAQAESVPSLLIAAARLSIATLFLTPIVLRKHIPDIQILTRREIMLTITAGGFLALHFAAWVTSLEYTSVLVSVVFVTTSPIWVAILEVFFLKAQLARPVIIGLVITIIGGMIIGGAGIGNETLQPGQNDLIGSVLSIIGAITVAAYLIIGRRIRRKMPVIPYIWMVYGSAGILLGIVIIVTGIPITGYSNEGYLFMVLLAIFPQLLGHSSFNYAVGYIPATIVSLATQMEPIGSAILAFFVLREFPLPLQVVGSMVILGGVILASIGQSRTSNNAEKKDKP